MQDLPDGGGTKPKGERQPIIWPNFVENSMKTKKIGPEGASPKFCYVDPPLGFFE